MKGLYKILIILLTVYLVWFIYKNFFDMSYKRYRDNVNRNITVVVINLDRAQDRMKKTSKTLLDYGFTNIKRIKGVDGKGIKIKIILKIMTVFLV